MCVCVCVFQLRPEQQVRAGIAKQPHVAAHTLRSEQFGGGKSCLIKEYNANRAYSSFMGFMRLSSKVKLSRYQQSNAHNMEVYKYVHTHTISQSIRTSPRWNQAIQLTSNARKHPKWRTVRLGNVLGERNEKATTNKLFGICRMRDVCACVCARACASFVGRSLE